MAIGDIFHHRYTIIRKLGWGHFSTVWLSWDSQAHHYVALKIVKSAEHYTEAAEDEVLLLNAVSDVLKKKEVPFGQEAVVRLLDHFTHAGPHGNHVCMVFEVLGENLLKLIRRFDHRGLPLPVIKKIARRMLMGLDLLHRHAGVIHTDLKPENILICLDDAAIRAIAKKSLEKSIKEGEAKMNRPTASTIIPAQPSSASQMSRTSKRSSDSSAVHRAC